MVRRPSGLGLDFGLDQPTTNKIVDMLNPLIDAIAAQGAVAPGWEPQNDFQRRRLAKAYTDRGLKAA